MLTTLTPQTTVSGILDSASNYYIFKDNEVFISHILLLFKLYVYKSREKKTNINNLIVEIRKVKKIGKKLRKVTKRK